MSLILTIHGRLNGSTSYGDQTTAGRYRTLFCAV
jgi:hypothetical protein